MLSLLSTFVFCSPCGPWRTLSCKFEFSTTKSLSTKRYSAAWMAVHSAKLFKLFLAGDVTEVLFYLKNGFIQ